MTTEATADFACCDTRWRIHARGPGARDAVTRARDRVEALRQVLDAFDPGSAVARLNATGRIEDVHVAGIVRRAREYRLRTGGVFDVAHGTLEHAVKAYHRGATMTLAASPRRATYRTVGATGVETDAPLDLNGLAKGYIVDRAQALLKEAGCDGFVDGGGDIARPTGPVAIESPFPGRPRVGVLDTRWNVATSGNARRSRNGVGHLYDARDGRVGARHDQVTVVAARDCMEADALATTLAVLPLRAGLDLIEAWEGAEALWVDGDRLTASSGFEPHVWKA